MTESNKKSFFSLKIHNQIEAERAIKSAANVFLALGILFTLVQFFNNFNKEDAGIAATILMGIIFIIPSLFLNKKNSLVSAIILLVISAFSFASGLLLIFTAGFPAGILLVLIWGLLGRLAWRAIKAINFIKTDS